MIVTISVVAKNEEKRIRSLLESLEAQEVPPWLRIEVLLVDNGSRDSTMRIMQDYASTSRYRVRVERVIGTLGKARNAALSMAEGDYVAFIDADEIASRRWIRSLVEAARSLGCEAVLGPVVFMRASSTVSEYFHSRSILDLLHSLGAMRVRGRKTFNTGNLLLDRSAALSVGFRDDITVSEDGEFSYRFLRRGYRLCFQPEALVFHPSPRSGAGLVSYYWKLGVANAALLRYHPSLEMLLYVLGNVASNIHPGVLLAPLTMGRGARRLPLWTLYSIASTLVMAATVAWPGTWARLTRSAPVQRRKED